MSDLTRIGLAFAAMAVLMTILWLVQRVRKNAGIVDVAWSFGTGINGVWFALTGSGYGPRRMILAAMVKYPTYTNPLINVKYSTLGKLDTASD